MNNFENKTEIWKDIPGYENLYQVSNSGRIKSIGHYTRNNINGGMRLPKFRNGVQTDESGKNIPGTSHMIFNWFTWERDGKEIPKIHPAQKPVKVLKQLIEIFTDPGDVVIDPCAGSGSTLRAATELVRSAYGFEIDRNFYRRAKDEMLCSEKEEQMSLFEMDGGLNG